MFSEDLMKGQITPQTGGMEGETLLNVTEDRDPENNNAYLKVRDLKELILLRYFNPLAISHFEMHEKHPQLV